MSCSGFVLKAPTSTMAPSVVSKPPVSGYEPQEKCRPRSQPHRRFLHLHGEHRFEQRHRDLLAAAGLLALQQREQDRLNEMHARRVVAERRRVDGERLVVVAFAAHHAGERLRQDVLSALVGERPASSEAGAEGAR